MEYGKKSETPKYLFHQGTNFYAYDFLGVHLIKDKGKSFYEFRVWAPNAEEVFLTGDFNDWKPSLPMKAEGENGLWCVRMERDSFKVGYKYKYIIKRGDKYIYKADPYSNYFELPPNTASIYFDIDGFKWTDSKWLKYRDKTVIPPEYKMPMNIYEVNLGSWRLNDDGSWLNYREIALKLAPYVKKMGYTHIELMPVSEYPFDGSWGYQVCGYYAPTSRFGTPHDFMYFIDYMHNSGIGVILDWVPAHFPKDAHGLYEFDGSPLYEYQGEDKMEHKEWGTRRFDVGRNEVESFLISNALFWLRKYHLDGLRVDAVSSMLYLDYGKNPGEWFPNSQGGNENFESIAFFQRLGNIIISEFPSVLFIAEESTAWSNVTKPASEGGLGFTHKWNMGWMNDVLEYFSLDPYFRKYNHNRITFSMMYAYAERYILPVSHDEVVHGKKSLLDKMPGDYNQKFANTRAFFMYMLSHPGKKLSFMGNEIGQFTEWNYKGSIEWFLLGYEMHRKLNYFLSVLNNFYIENDELWENDNSWEGFKWIDANNGNLSILSYIRYNSKMEPIIVILNLTPVPRPNYAVEVPKGTYIEVLNSDSNEFGGFGTTNPEPIEAKELSKDSERYFINLNLPSLGGIYLKPYFE